jgi:hypothetical protein
MKVEDVLRMLCRETLPLTQYTIKGEQGNFFKCKDLETHPKTKEFYRVMSVNVISYTVGMFSPDNEYTFTMPHTGYEFMIWFDKNGRPCRIYTYSDIIVGGIDIATWEKKNQNSCFVHCPADKVEDVWKLLNGFAICADETVVSLFN